MYFGLVCADLLLTALAVEHRLSAIEVERALLEHTGIAEAAVFGVPDDTWGEIVVALVRPRVEGSASVRIDEAAVAAHCEKHLAPEKRPRVVRVVDDIKKNVMGKVNKKELISQFKR